MTAGCPVDPDMVPMSAGTLPEPGPPPRTTIPYLRLVRDVAKLTGVYEEMRDSTGPVTRVVLGPRRVVPPFVVVTAPRGAREVLSSHGVFDKEGLFFDEVRDLFGLNVFDAASASWKPRRRTLQPLFTRTHVASFATHMAAAAEDLAERWSAAPGTVDLESAARRLTLAVLGRTLFGHPLDEDALSIGRHVERALRHVKNRTFVPLRAPAWSPSYPRRRARRSEHVLRALIAQAVDRRAPADGDDGELIDLLRDATDPETGERMTRETIIDELMVFLIAGHDTTATTLTAAMWLLGRHPRIQEQVATEARAVGPHPTADDVPRLATTGRVLQEAMRLYPPGSFLPRRAMQDTTVEGYRISAGTDVVVSTWAIHRDPALWPDPTRFDPDRFLPEVTQHRDRWAYLPFGGGPRSCVGDHFAMTEATLALATLVRRLRITSTGRAFPYTVPFTLVAKGPVPAAVRPRE